MFRLYILNGTRTFNCKAYCILALYTCSHPVTYVCFKDGSAWSAWEGTSIAIIRPTPLSCWLRAIYAAHAGGLWFLLFDSCLPCLCLEVTRNEAFAAAKSRLCRPLCFRKVEWRFVKAARDSWGAWIAVACNTILVMRRLSNRNRKSNTLVTIERDRNRDISTANCDFDHTQERS